MVTLNSEIAAKQKHWPRLKFGGSRTFITVPIAFTWRMKLFRPCYSYAHSGPAMSRRTWPWTPTYDELQETMSQGEWRGSVYRVSRFFAPKNHRIYKVGLSCKEKPFFAPATPYPIITLQYSHIYLQINTKCQNQRKRGLKDKAKSTFS